MSTLLLADHDGHQLKKATLQAITAAQAFNTPIDVLVLGSETAAVAAQAASIAGVARVIAVSAPHLAHVLPEDAAAIILDQLNAGYTTVIAAHTTLGKDTLPRVAALRDVGMASDVIRIHARGQYERPIYAGNAIATIHSDEALQVLTIRATSYAAAAAGNSAEIISHSAPAAQAGSQWLADDHKISDRPELATAPVVVSGGRCLGERFDEVLAPLAARLGAALGATRAAVDAGLAPNEIQVGQTGTIVAPELYIAAGISGAAQHLGGMKDSKVIVAINTDPDAPIFKVADIGIVADLFDVVPELTRQLG